MTDARTFVELFFEAKEKGITPWCKVEINETSKGMGTRNVIQTYMFKTTKDKIIILQLTLTKPYMNSDPCQTYYDCVVLDKSMITFPPKHK